MAVQWLPRYAGDSTRRTFVKEAYPNGSDYDVVNSSELRLTGFDLQVVQLPLAVHWLSHHCNNVAVHALV